MDVVSGNGIDDRCIGGNSSVLPDVCEKVRRRVINCLGV